MSAQLEAWVRFLIVNAVLAVMSLVATGCGFVSFLPEPAAHPTAASATLSQPLPPTLAAAQSRSSSESDATPLEPLLAAWRAAGVEPFCLQLSDVDGDGEGEWVGLHQNRAGGQAGVRGFVLDQGQFYPLGAPAGAGDVLEGVLIGDDAVCRLRIADVNADGQAEIVAGGQKRDGQQQLSLFVWDSSGQYRLLGRFAGNEKVELVDEDLNGAHDVLVANRAGLGVVLEEISVWNGTEYVPSRSRYARQATFSIALPAGSPQQALIKYYLALQERDLLTAYQILSPAMRERQKYEAFLLSHAAVFGYELDEVHRAGETSGYVWLRAELRLQQKAAQRGVMDRFRGEWQLLWSEQEAAWQITGLSLVPAE